MVIFGLVCFLLVVGFCVGIPLCLYRYSQKMKLRAMDEMEGAYRSDRCSEAEELELAGHR